VPLLLVTPGDCSYSE